MEDQNNQKQGRRNISGKDIATIMGIDATIYEASDVPNTSSNYISPIDVLSESNVVENFPEGVQRINSGTGPYYSGEVWRDTWYSTMYLYVGKTPDGKDVSIVLGGDTFEQGQVKHQVINSEGVFFDERWF